MMSEGVRSDSPAGSSPSGGDSPVAEPVVKPQSRRSWVLLALGGAVCARLFTAETRSVSEAPDPQRSAPSGVSAELVSRSPGAASPRVSALAASANQAGITRAAPPVAAAPREPRKAPGGTPATKLEPRASASAASSRSVAELELAARPVAPGKTWQNAANTSDWPGVAMLIDGLPEAERSLPGTRYARAVAARELGQYDVALGALAGLESELPLLHDEIKSARAHCQLEVGPFEEAYQYFTEEQSPENLILAAQACANGGDLALAQQTVERAFAKIKKQGSDSKRGRRNEVAARALRARVAEAGGEGKVAARDWLWLATQAPIEDLGATADDAYERLSGTQLNSVQRLERMRSFSLEGQLDRTLREQSRLASAPGPVTNRIEVASALAWAYYHSRKDYVKAAELFREASELSSDTRVKYLFFAARALSRANQDDRAIALYEELAQRYPASGYTEQAQYRIAQLEYGLGRWDKAEGAYTRYLDRYAKNGGGQYAGSSRYELAISRLGAKQRTEEAALTLGQLAKKERRPERRAMLTHLEAVGLETTQDPKKMLEAIARYKSIIDEQPLSFAAMASAARLRHLGRPEEHRVRLSSAPFATLLPEQNTLSMQLPAKARFLADIGLHTDAERALFDERDVVRRLVGRDGRALCEMYGALDRGYRSYSLAHRLLRTEDLGSPPVAGNLWAWRCAYPEPYRDIVNAVEARYGLPSSLVHAVMRQESAFRPNVVSPAGAIGLMQLMPNTARRAAEEITQQPGAPWVPDPSRPTNVLNNVELGGFYLSKLLAMLGGQLPVAVAAYNAGPGPVSRWLEGGEDLPVDVWVARIPFSETRDYVSIVLGNWLAYRYLDNPDALPELELALKPGTREAADAY